MALRAHRLPLRSKVESWIRDGCNPKLGFGVGRRDEAGGDGAAMARRAHRLPPRSKVESWIRDGCNPKLAIGVGRRDEASVMVEV